MNLGGGSVEGQGNIPVIYQIFLKYPAAKKNFEVIGRGLVLEPKTDGLVSEPGSFFFRDQLPWENDHVLRDTTGYITGELLVG